MLSYGPPYLRLENTSPEKMHDTGNCSMSVILGLLQ